MKSAKSYNALKYPIAIALVAAASSLLLNIVFGIMGFKATPYIRSITVIACAAFIFFFIIKTKLKPRLKKGTLFKLSVALQALSVLYLIISIARSNNRLYTASDFIYLSILFLTFAYGAWSFKKHSLTYAHEEATKLIIYLFLGFAILSPFKVAPGTELIILWACFLIIAIAQKNTRAAIILIIVMTPQLPGINRAFLLSMAAALALLFFSSSASSKIKITVSLTIVLAVFASIFQETTLLQGSNLERRINETIYLAFKDGHSELPIPIQQRLYEGDIVFNDIQSGPAIINLLFGMGHGYTMNMTDSPDSSVIYSQLLGGENTHNIHFLHYALLARFGIIGSIIFLIIFIIATSKAYTILKLKAPEEHCLTLISSIYVFMLFIFAAPASSFLLSSMVAGYFLGIISESTNPRKLLATHLGKIQ